MTTLEIVGWCAYLFNRGSSSTGAHPACWEHTSLHNILQPRASIKKLSLKYSLNSSRNPFILSLPFRQTQICCCRIYTECGLFSVLGSVVRVSSRVLVRPCPIAEIAKLVSAIATSPGIDSQIRAVFCCRWGYILSAQPCFELKLNNLFRSGGQLKELRMSLSCIICDGQN